MTKGRGIILKISEARENDLFVTFLTESGNIIGSFAKAAKKSKKRFAGKLNLYSECEFEISGKNTLLWVSPITSPTLPGSEIGLLLFMMKNVVSEIILKIFHQSYENDKIYHETKKFFSNVPDEITTKELLNLFAKTLLSTIEISGFKPDLDFCASCGNRLLLENSPYYLEPGKGFVCSKCASSLLQNIRIEYSELKALKNIMNSDEISDKISEDELKKIIDVNLFYVEQLTGKRLNSWEELKRLI